MKLKSNGTCVYRVLKENILPGINYIKNPGVLEHPHVKARIEEGVFELLESKQDNKDLKDLGYNDLMQEIKSIYDYKLLKSLLNDEKRSSVIKALKSQLNKITDYDS